jgi:hypothetical protein
MNKIILLSSENINKNDFFNKLTNLNILPLNNNKIPICIRLGKYKETKILYKSKDYIINNQNDILYNIEKIMKNLTEDINFDKIIIEINSNMNLEYYDLPSFKNDYVDNKLISLYEKYLQLEDIIIINFINNLSINNYIELIENLNIENQTILINTSLNKEINNTFKLDQYQQYFQIYNENYDDVIVYLNKKINKDKINESNILIKKIINLLYLDLDNYEDILKANYEEFYNSIYLSKKYRHRHFYKNYEYSKENIFFSNNYKEIKKDFDSNNFELLDEFKNNKNLIEQAIEIFDETFDFYIKKLEPEILKYFLIMYHNHYDDEFQSNKENEFLLLIKGLKKMCLLIVKKNVSLNNGII